MTRDPQRVGGNAHDRAAQRALFELTPPQSVEPALRPLLHPVWTENKARLIARYLYFFVLVTKHGTYIDGFAGPQKRGRPDTWAAKLVLESEPRWFRHFFLFDRNRNQHQRLLALKAAQPDTRPPRQIEVCRGDFNKEVRDLLSSGFIRGREATFCLLDQRTFECHWATVELLARHRQTSRKIELFYFLPISWLDRAFASLRDGGHTLTAWWGRSDWRRLMDMSYLERRDAFVERFKSELAYASVKAWPIYDRQGGSRVMYYMIHATDHHSVAPELMRRAYEKAVTPPEPREQLELEFAGFMGSW